MTKDEQQFLQLLNRLKHHLGFNPEGKGMMDLLNACCDRMDALERYIEELELGDD